MEDWRVGVRQCLLGFGNVFAAYRDVHAWEPSAESPAAVALSSEPDLRGEWSDEPVHDMLALTALQVTAAVEFLEGVARLLDDEPLAFAPAALARSAIEVAGRSWWLLEPELTPEARVQRAMTERLYGLWNNRKLPEQIRATEVWDRKIRRIVTEARTRGFVVREGSERNAPSIGVQRPTATRLAEQVIGMGDLGATLYRHLSATTHGTTSLAQAVDPEIDEAQLHCAPVVVRADSVTLLAFGAARACAQTLDRLIGFYGWDATQWNSWRKFSIRKLWRLLETVPSPSRRVADPDVSPPDG